MTAILATTAQIPPAVRFSYIILHHLLHHLLHHDSCTLFLAHFFIRFTRLIQIGTPLSPRSFRLLGTPWPPRLPRLRRRQQLLRRWATPHWEPSSAWLSLWQSLLLSIIVVVGPGSQMSQFPSATSRNRPCKKHDFIFVSFFVQLIFSQRFFSPWFFSPWFFSFLLFFSCNKQRVFSFAHSFPIENKSHFRQLYFHFIFFRSLDNKRPKRFPILSYHQNNRMSLS